VKKYFESITNKVISSSVITVIVLGIILKIILIKEKNTISINNSFFIISILVFVTGFCLLLKKINIYSDINKLKKLLKNYNNDNSITNNETFNKSISELETIKDIYEDYQKTLIIRDKKIIQTIDSEFYFNVDNLIKDKINYKFISYIPQLLIGIGLLGTFLGLSLGLSGLDLTDLKTEEINKLIDGAKTSFYTSLYGMYFSIWFSVITNIIIGYYEQIISKIKNDLNSLFSKNIINDEIIDLKHAISNRLDDLKSINKTMQNDFKESINSLSGKMSNSFQTELSKIFNKELINNFNKLKDDIYTINDENKNFMTNYKSQISKINEHLEKIHIAYSKLSSNDFLDLFEKIKTEIIYSLKEHDNSIIVYKNEIKEITIQLLNVKEGLKSINFNEISQGLLSLKEELSNELKEAKNFMSIYKREIAGITDENIKIKDSYKDIVNSFERIEQSFVKMENKYKNIDEIHNKSIKSFENLLNLYKGNEIITNSVSEFIHKFDDFNKSVNLFEKVENNVITLLNEYKNNFENINKSLKTDINEHKNYLKAVSEELKKSITNGVKDYLDIIEGIRKETLEYNKLINQGVTGLFKDYDNNLYKIVEKFNGTLNIFSQKIDEVKKIENSLVDVVTSINKNNEYNESIIKHKEDIEITKNTDKPIDFLQKKDIRIDNTENKNDFLQKK